MVKMVGKIIQFFFLGFGLIVSSEDCDVYDGSWEKRETPAPKFNCELQLKYGILNLRRQYKCRYYTPNGYIAPQKYLDEVLQWEWVPRHCDRLKDVDPEAVDAFLARKNKSDLRGRKIYFIGDSLTIQMYLTLHCLLLDRVDESATSLAVDDLIFKSGTVLSPALAQSHAPLFNRTNMGTYVLRGGGAVELLFSDHLVDQHGRLLEEPEVTLLPNSANGLRVQTAWKRRIVEDSRPGDIVIFNTGAHYRKHQLDRYRGMIDSVFTFLRDHFPGRVFFRTNHHGVSPCLHNFSGPLKTAPPVKQLFNYRNLSYMNEYARQRASVLGLLDPAPPGDTESRGKVHFLNVTLLTSLRCDRCDFLHFCIPGPQYEWVRLLFHQLMG